MSATARVIDPGAATCRIREERHTAEQYEKLKPNEGQPLDVWRVELVVANYSGRPLDYVNAHLNVTSDWPPCDHWDGPKVHYGAPVVWTGPLISIQDVGIVEPGEEVRETAFVLSWHDEDPALGRWDIDYDFAAEGEAVSTTPDANHRPASDGQRERAATGTTPAADSTRVAGSVAYPICTGATAGSTCRLELEPPHSGCYVFFNGDFPGEGVSVAWDGHCSAGLADGSGSLTLALSGKELATGAGELRDGAQTGHWIWRFPDGYVEEGPYVDGKKNGHWTQRFADGVVWEGTYVDGKRNGHWIEPSLLGYKGWVNEGPYVDGKKNGRWTEEYGAGWVNEGPYVDGRRTATGPSSAAAVSGSMRKART